MPDSSPSDRGGGWVVAQIALMVLVVVLVFLPPFWPRQLSFVGIPLAVLGADRLRLVGAFARQVDDAVSAPAGNGRADREGPLPVRPPPDLCGGLPLLPRRRALVERARRRSGALALGTLWWRKAAVEEAHLAARFPEYEDYRRRVRRL